MADLTADQDVDIAARLAVLTLLKWPDDRAAPAPWRWGTPAGHYWALAGQVVAAVAAPVLRAVADEHDLLTSGPGIWPSATAWMRHRADCWPDLFPPKPEHAHSEETDRG